MPLLVLRRVRLAGPPEVADAPLGVLIRDVTGRDDFFGGHLGRCALAGSWEFVLFLWAFFGHWSSLVINRMFWHHTRSECDAARNLPALGIISEESDLFMFARRAIDTSLEAPSFKTAAMAYGLNAVKKSSSSFSACSFA